MRVSLTPFLYALTEPLLSSYVLERHLLRDQVISQDAHELGKFRGESVYSRSQVLQLKAAENWMRHGRVVRAGEQPLKYVKQRAATLNRRRELEIRADAEGADGSNGAMQGLYAEGQTERYIPPAVVDVRSRFTHSQEGFLFTRASIDVGKDSEKQLWKHRFIRAFHASFWSGAHPTYAVPIHSSVPPVEDYLLLFVFRQRCGEDRAPIGF